MKTFVYAAALALGLVACSTHAPPAAAPAPTATLDSTCRPPLHECPKCGTEGGYYCGMYCMDCPVLLDEDATLQQQPALALTCR